MTGKMLTLLMMLMAFLLVWFVFHIDAFSLTCPAFNAMGVDSSERCSKQMYYERISFHDDAYEKWLDWKFYFDKPISELGLSCKGIINLVNDAKDYGADEEAYQLYVDWVEDSGDEECIVSGWDLWITYDYHKDGSFTKGKKKIFISDKEGTAEEFFNDFIRIRGAELYRIGYFKVDDDYEVVDKLVFEFDEYYSNKIIIPDVEYSGKKATFTVIGEADYVQVLIE